MCNRGRWAGETGVILGLAALVAAKMWTLITPWGQSREFLGRDFGLAVEPYFYHLLKRGVVPLWDPTLGTGSPFLGGGTHHPMFLQAHLHLFYPLNLLWLGLAEQKQFIAHAVLQYHHAFHYQLAGVFTYLYGRQLGLTRFPASVSAIAFMFSGFLLAHIYHWTIVDTIVWLPLILACLVRADATERLRWGALAGLFLGVAFLAGHPQIFYYVGLAATALALTLLGRRLAGRRPWRRLAVVLLLVPLVALGIAAVQLLPSWQMGVASHRAGLDYGWKATGSLPPSFLFQLLLPWGLLSVGGWAQNASEFSVYPGLLPLIFAGYALARRWDWRIGFHAGLGLGALLLAFGGNYHLHRVAFDLLPGFNLFRIPARILGLVGFAFAILAGLGVQEFLHDLRPRGLLRFLRWTAVAAGAGAVPIYLLLIWSQGRPAADAVQGLADQYMLFLLLLLVIFISVGWQARGHAPALVRFGLLLALLLDLLFGSFPASDASPDPDPRPAAEKEWVELLRQEREPIRMSRGDRIHPRTIYRYGWGVFDGESTFAPQPFLDLYFLAKENPQILDLLNVKYVVAGDGTVPAPGGETRARLALWPGAVRRIVLPEGPTVRQIEFDSHLVYGLHLRQGEMVATLHALREDGSTHRFPLRAGLETGEWALDRPWGRPAHAKPTRVARSWAVPGEGFEGHTYRATLSLPPGLRPRELILERSPSQGVFVVERIRLDGRDLSPPQDRFRLVRPGLYENRYALPRAFLLRRARQVPPDRLLEELKDFDPREELLLTNPLPGGWRAPPSLQGPLPPVKVLEYTPDRIRLETEIGEPLFLLLSDTYDPGWRAWDNGRPVTILRANHALRALPLAPGRHMVEFRYQQPSFWIGLAVSLGTLVALGAGSLASLWVRPRTGH